MLLHSPHILGRLGLCDPDGVSPSGHADPDILLPVRRVQAVDPHHPFYAMVVDLLQGVEQGIPGRVLLVLRHRVLQIQHDGIRLINIGVLDKARLLAVQKHHGTS